MAHLVILAFVVVIVFLLVRILNLTDSPRTPKIFSSNSSFINTVLQSCPILLERYVYLKLLVSFDQYQNGIREFYVN